MSKLHQIALTLIPGVGDKTARKLLSYCGGVEEVFRLEKSELSRIPGLKNSQLREFNKTEILNEAEKELSFIEKYNIKILFYSDEEYPYRLKQCVDSPVLIYYKGNADLNTKKVISFVGSRKPTDYGRSICQELVTGLACQDILIISGLAYGIDACSHKTALEVNLPTVGVVGHGLDRIYPYQNRKLAEEMVKRGGILTEITSGNQPDRENFPKRNRIVAGMSDAIVVVEADIKSGAIITAEIANSYNRDVFAVPGRLGDDKSTGCNFLIKTNKAALVQSIEDINYIMGWEKRKDDLSGKQLNLFQSLSDEEKGIVKILREHQIIGIDELCVLSGINGNKIASLLLNLEFSGIVKCMPGKRFSLNKF